MACSDCCSRTLQSHDGAGAAMRDEGRKAQIWDAEVVDEVLCRSADDADRNDPVNLFGVKSGVGNCFQRGFDLQLECALG